MATVFTHAALPALIARDFLPRELSARRLTVAAVLCGCLPDLDLLGYAFDLRPPDLWSHRGITHSLVFAAGLGLVAAVAFFPSLVKTPRALLKTWLCLSLWGASHGLLDALTRGEAGVALLAPFTAARFLFPFHPIPVTPLGADEALGRWGLLVVFNEALLLVAPALLLARAVKLIRRHHPLGRLAILVGAWLALAGVLKLALPDAFAPSQTRVLSSFGAPGSDEDPAQIPLDGLPGGRLVTHFEELKSLGLFNSDLTPSAAPWSSSFFPSWLGGASGRWRDGNLALLGRTLTGVGLPSLDADPWPLSPTEKYDLAVGNRGFEVSRPALAATHNSRPRPRFWFGLCNGVASAALERPEPFRTVDVVSPEGRTVRFHPNDVKALLGSAYEWVDDTTELGGSCKQLSLDSGKLCSMNPGGLVLATLNRLGLAHRSFLVDVHPSPQSQNYAVARARVNLLRGPYPFDGRATTLRLANRVTSLADVEVRFVVSSTTLPYATADVLAAPGDPTRYQRVGLHEVPFVWTATLALDETSDIIGGQWSGEPPDGPDSVAFVSGGPWLTDAGTLRINSGIRWDVVDALATASVDETAGTPTVDLRALDGGR